MTTPTTTPRIGFYGAGLIRQMHAFLLSQSERSYVITAVHDPDATRAEAFASAWGGTPMGEDELLDAVDAVYVTTWTSEHVRLVAKIAARDIPVFCEKPLAFDADQARQLIESASGVTNQVGLILRFMPAFIIAKNLIADPRAGRVLAVFLRDDQYLPVQGRYGSSWRIDPSKAGRGTLLEHSIHDVDILQWMLGPVTTVSGVSREVHGIERIEDVVAATLTFDSGAVAQLLSIWHDVLERPSLRHVEIFCERLHVVIENELEGPVRWQFTGDDLHSSAGDELAPLAREHTDHDLGPSTGALGGSIFNTATEFLDAVAEGRPADPSLSAALYAHTIVDAIYASAAEGGIPRACPPA